MAYNTNNFPPTSGRFLREDGSTFNIADLFTGLVGEVKPTNYIYVSKGGNDTSGDGSANFPYLTISAAITAANPGTTIFVFPGNYTENITYKAGVYITSPAVYSVYIVGNHTANFSGTVINENIILQNPSSAGSGTTLAFSGTSAQNLQFYNSFINSASISGAGDSVNWTNTNPASLLQIIDGNINVATSGAAARAFYSGTGSAGSFIANRATFKIDNINNVCLSIGGAVAYTHTADQVIGQVVVSNSASATIAMVSMFTGNIPVLTTTSTGATTVINDTVTTNSTPAFSGSGVFTDVALLYTSSGVGGSSTLNSGLGAISLPMSSVKLRSSALVPSGQIAAGQNTGAFEFDGSHLYFTIGTTRYTVV